jgi:hypothetical protein
MPAATFGTEIASISPRVAQAAGSSVLKRISSQVIRAAGHRDAAPQSSWDALRDAKLDPEAGAGAITLPGGPGRRARSCGGIDCPAIFIFDPVGRH